MGRSIKDGTGLGREAKVDPDFRLHTHSVTLSENLEAGTEGESFNLNTGLISFSTDGTLLYLKNNEDDDLLVEAIAIGSFEGVTYSDDPYITLIKNPTGGDLINDATAVAINETRNFGSSRALVADVYKGKSSGTISGGSDTAILQVTPGGRSFYTIGFILKRGNSLAIKLTLNESSGSANYYAAVICYLRDPEQ